jgi:hypothetical protein
MKDLLKLSSIVSLTIFSIFNGSAQASVTYNLTGWDSSGTGGVDGGFPANWIGSSAPNYIGSLNAMWYANVGIAGLETVSSSGARSIAGVDPTYSLAVGPRAWNDNTSGTQGQGHGSDFGLIHLNDASNLSITVAADTTLSSTLKPGLSLFHGWDTGNSSVRVQAFQNNGNNPLGTTGLTFLNSASTTSAGGSATYLFSNLAAGDYSLFVGGNFSGGSGAAGKYTVNLTASAVPIPAAIWLFASAMTGLFGFCRPKNLETI